MAYFNMILEICSINPFFGVRTLSDIIYFLVHILQFWTGTQVPLDDTMSLQSYSLNHSSLVSRVFLLLLILYLYRDLLGWSSSLTSLLVEPHLQLLFIITRSAMTDQHDRIPAGKLFITEYLLMRIVSTPLGRWLQGFHYASFSLCQSIIE